MSLFLHCDKDGCAAHQRLDSSFPGFYRLYHQDGDPVADFCSLDHLMHWASAVSEPTTEVDV